MLQLASLWLLQLQLFVVARRVTNYDVADAIAYAAHDASHADVYDADDAAVLHSCCRIVSIRKSCSSYYGSHRLYERSYHLLNIPSYDDLLLCSIK
jgi:hypothetical protein